MIDKGMTSEKALDEPEKKVLRRRLGPLQIQLISLAGIIGSAYFMGAGSLIAENGASTLLAFLLGGLIVWLVSMAMGELCIGMPREGSFVSQSRELMGRPWATSIGWSYWFNWCAYIPSEMIAGGIILHQIFPQIPVITWATLFASIITVVNLLNVRHFGHMESGLALLKIGAMAVFTVVAGMIWLGWTGGESLIHTDQTLSLAKELTQSISGGTFAFLFTMVLVLVNFQGTELIALSAAETRNPEKSIPLAARNVAVRIIALFVIPLAMLLLIFPRNEASGEQSIFAEALSRNGFKTLASLFQFVVVSAALSCANSGLYGAARSLYGLGKEGLAPSWTAKVNSQGVPALATLMTIGVSWAFLPLYIFFEGTSFYTWLLSLSGFTGAICWISISWCQIKLRKNVKDGTIQAASVSYQMPGFPYLSWISVVLQIFCLVLVAFHPTLRSSLILGIPAVFLPGLLCLWKDRNWYPICNFAFLKRLGHHAESTRYNDENKT